MYIKVREQLIVFMIGLSKKWNKTRDSLLNVWQANKSGMKTVWISKFLSVLLPSYQISLTLPKKRGKSISKSSEEYKIFYLDSQQFQR